MEHKSSYVTKIAAAALTIVMATSAVFVPVSATGNKESENTDAVIVSGSSQKDGVNYLTYFSQHKDEPVGADNVVIPADSYTEATDGLVTTVYNDYEGASGASVLFSDTGKVTYTFNIQSAGMYVIKFKYFTGSASGSSIVRDIEIDGAYPFVESKEVSLPQLWSDKTTKAVYDKLNNQIRSKQIQNNAWHTEYAEDVSGFSNGPMRYYLSAGAHTIALESEREAMILNQIEILGLESTRSYKEVKAEYDKKGYKDVSAKADITIQGEDPNAIKSEQTMFALNDRTSPSVYPYNVNLTRYNTVGGANWEIANQWIEWEFEATETGLYNIATHFKQSQKVNDVSIRELYIDGELPFAECQAINFYYDNAWQSKYIGPKDGEPYKFYLTKGTHKIRLKVGMGEATEMLVEAKSYLSDLNVIYRKIVMVTGVDPDKYRDYNFDKVAPEVLEQMKDLSKKIKALTQKVADYNGQSGASTVALKRLTTQIDEITKDPDKIASNLSSFQSNVASFGTWINDETIHPLELDCIKLQSPDSKLAKGEAGFFGMLWHYTVQFLYSFVTDYESVGVMEETSDTNLTVWLTTGRDQAQTLKQMINDGFTPNTGVTANLQLITPAALLPSILAGTGPDVYTGITQAEPVNLALRDALVNLKKFKDFESIQSRFFKGATTSFTLNDGVYAIPDTVDYYMLFVRTDILEDLGISLDQLNDWDTILSDVLPVLQINSLAFGVPVAIHSYLSFLYQNGGDVYAPDGKTSALAENVAIEAMSKFTDLYTQYGFNLAYDFANRFRSGELPIAVANLSSYNQLSVFAPDINGLWTMLPIPGTYKADGTLDRSTPSTLTGSVIMSKSKNKDAAWEYLKWWSSADTQHEYGSQLESIMGSAARYNTANVEAFSRISWNRKMKGNLLKQLESVKAFREVPGGYLTQRYYDFSFRYIVYDGDNVRDTLTESVDNINREIKHKRAEYNLD